MTDPSPDIRSRALISRDHSRLLIVDVQEKFVAVIPVARKLIANCRKPSQWRTSWASRPPRLNSIRAGSGRLFWN